MSKTDRARNESIYLIISAVNLLSRWNTQYSQKRLFFNLTIPEDPFWSCNDIASLKRRQALTNNGRRSLFIL